MKKQLVEKNAQQLRTETLNTLQKILPSLHPSALTTDTLARALGVKAGTIRRGLCVDGHYLGLTPTKLGNGRLLWPIA